MEHNLELSAIYVSLEYLVTRENPGTDFQNIQSKHYITYSKICKSDQLPMKLGYTHLYPICPHREELFALCCMVV